VSSGGGVELDRAVDSIRVGHRYRHDLGDLDELCASIQKLGILQPITITPDGTLVCGARRLAAVKRLEYKRVKVWVTSTVSTSLAEVLAEQHENTVRKPFTPTEAAVLYAELKQLYAADAARRQQATRFGASGGDGGGKFPPPHGPASVASIPAGKARERAARAITGQDSSRSLDRVIEVQRLAEDPTTPERVREIARLELAGMDADGKVNGHYLTVQATASTDALARLADDPTHPTAVRERAASELDGLDQDRPAVELVRAARAAIERATSRAPTGEDSINAEVTDDGDGSGAGLRVVAVKRYGLRAFLATVQELDGWWQHYDPAEIAAALTEEQWQRLCANRDGSSAFIQAIAAARHADGRQERATDRPSRAACL
jgi:ParB family transcriptional regulator, chromosome partitioning protein